LRSLRELWVQLTGSGTETERLTAFEGLIQSPVVRSLWRLIIESFPPSIEWAQRLSQLGHMPELRQLCLQQCPITRRGIAAILNSRQFPKLWHVTILPGNGRFDLIRHPETGWNELPDSYSTTEE